MPSLTIGDVAARAGLSPKAVRIYEARGLIPPPWRTAVDYRVYGEEILPLLGFIRQARALGLSLDEIKRIIDLQRSGAQPCGTVLPLLDHHIREIDETMSSLRALRKTLVAARASARATAERGEDAVVCRLIEAAPQTTSPINTARAGVARGRRG